MAQKWIIFEPGLTAWDLAWHILIKRSSKTPSKNKNKFLFWEGFWRLFGQNVPSKSQIVRPGPKMDSFWIRPGRVFWWVLTQIRTITPHFWGSKFFQIFRIFRKQSFPGGRTPAWDGRPMIGLISGRTTKSILDFLPVGYVDFSEILFQWPEGLAERWHPPIGPWRSRTGSGGRRKNYFFRSIFIGFLDIFFEKCRFSKKWAFGSLRLLWEILAEMLKNEHFDQKWSYFLHSGSDNFGG